MLERGHLHSPQEIPRNECCCCEQPIGKQQNGGKFVLLLCDWLFTTTTFIPWDYLWAMPMSVHGRRQGKGGRIGMSLSMEQQTTDASIQWEDIKLAEVTRTRRRWV